MCGCLRGGGNINVNNILLYSLDDIFPKVDFVSAVNVEGNDLLAEISPLAADVSNKITITSEAGLAAYKTTKDVPSNPASGDYTLDKVTHGNNPYIFIMSHLLFRNSRVLRSTLTANSAGVFTGNNTKDIFAQTLSDSVSLALVGEEFYDSYKRGSKGFITTTLYPYIDGDRTRSFQITTAKQNSAQIYESGANYEYKSSIIKVLKAGGNTYYGFYVITSHMPTNAAELANPPKTLKHYVLVVRQDKDGNRIRIRLPLDISPEDDTKADLGGYSLDGSVFELFSAESTTEGGN